MKITIYNYFGKLLFFLLIFMSFPKLSWSQSIHYHINENFTGFPGGVNALPYNGWTSVLQAGDFNFDTWRFNNPASRTISAPASGQVAQFDSDWYSNGGGAEDVSLTTPVIDTRGYDSVWVKWDHQFQAGFGGSWRVEAFNGLAWVTVVGPNTAQIAWRTDSVNISTACANKQNARVRFRWTGNYSWWWQVDNIRVYSPVRADECATIDAAMFAGQCGSSSDSVRLTIRNTSSGSMSNIPVKAQVAGTIGGSPINSSLTAVYSGTLAPGQIALISVGAFNTLAGGTIDVYASTDVVGDTKRSNDSVKLMGVSIFGTPALPTPVNNARCGAGTVTLDGGISSGNTGIWYDDAVTTSPSWSGATRTTPTLGTPGAVTYYVSQARISTYRNVNAGYGGNVWYGAANPGGNMFTVTAVNNLIIDSLGVHVPNTNATTVSVYYKTGGSAGFENTPSAWTLLSTVNVNGAGLGVATRIKIDPLTIPAGQTYSVYVRSSNEMQFTSGTYASTNADLTLSSATAVSGLFGGFNAGFSWNGTLYYRIYCESNRVAVTATANPAPQASDLAHVLPFRGKRFDGTVSSPDIVAPPDSVQYDILTPSGFLVSGYGSGGTWYVSNTDARTLNGVSIPAADYSLLVPAGGNGARIRFRPSTGLIDSTVRIRVTLTRNDNGCDTVLERVIYIAPRPNVNFNFPQTCDGQTVSFSNSSDITPSGSISHLWFFGDSTSSDFIDPTHLYSSHGTFDVKLYVTSNLGYTDSMIKTITIGQNPTPNFTFVNACEGSDITLTSTSVLPSGSGTFNWDYSHGTPGTGATTAKQYPAPGIYNVTLTVTDANGCQASVSKYVTQAPRAVPNFTFTATQCDNLGVNFTNTTTLPAFGATGFVWDFNDGPGFAGVSAEHSFSQFMPYDVKLIAKTEFGCVDSIIKTVILRESPKADFAHSALLCGNRPVDFTNNSTVPALTTNTYSWDFGDGSTSVDDDPTHIFPGFGSYTVVLKAENSNGCSDETQLNITILDNPIADFAATEVCEGVATQFTNNSISTTGQTLSYNWNFDNSTSATAADTSFTYADDGSYDVELIVSAAGGCSDTMIKTVIVNPVPVANILIASQMSRDGAFDFTADNVPGASYYWWFNGEGSSRSKDTSMKFMMDGRKVIKLLVTSDKGCVSSDQDTLWVNRLSVENLDGTTGKIAVYPNPSSGNFVVDMASVSEGEISSMSVTDMLGRTIISSVAVVPGSVSAIDLSSVSAGIYYLNITTASGVNSIKLNVVK